MSCQFQQPIQQQRIPARHAHTDQHSFMYNDIKTEINSIRKDRQGLHIKAGKSGYYTALCEQAGEQLFGTLKYHAIHPLRRLPSSEPQYLTVTRSSTIKSSQVKFFLNSRIK